MSETAKSCGTCVLWGPNFYPQRPGWPRNVTCAADAVMDVPASFKPNRQTMEAHEGADCIAWELAPLPAPKGEKEG